MTDWIWSERFYTLYMQRIKKMVVVKHAFSNINKGSSRGWQDGL